DFLDDVLKKFGFGNKWCNWIQCCLKSSRDSIFVNGSPTDEFQFYKGSKQGDPLSPFLFILIMESLHLSFQRVVDVGLFKGINLNHSLCLSHMFYAYDAIFMGQWSDVNITTLIHVLECFFHASGPKINLFKSKIMGVNVEGSYVNQAAVKLGCQVLTSPFIYLGTKVGGTMSRVQAWHEVVEKVKTRLSKCKMKTLSIRGRRTLLKSVLGFIPIFHMSIFRVPSKVLQILESIRDSIWTKVITTIHGVNGNVNSSGGKADRSCWLAIVDEVRVLHKKGVYVFDFMNLKLGNGEMVKFWLDRWFEGGILKDLFPRMFALENMKETQFSKLVELVQSISLMPINDCWVWNLESSGEFSVATIRRIIDETRFPNIGDTTRRVKYVPIKVNSLAWIIRCDVLPTRMNLSRRGIDIQAISCPICDYGVES
nr:RNA-directed DNA polymerase, eukaryota, reverse transcriptase zinc-binding domain protein [Tanacetum cinerariifolium]